MVSYFFRKPMVWSSVHDEMLYREIMAVNPFTGTKKSTVARGKNWQEVAENMNWIEAVYFKVDKRTVRDCYNLSLARELRSKLKKEKKARGIETDMRSIEVAYYRSLVCFCILVFWCHCYKYKKIKIEKIHMEIPSSWRRFHCMVE